MANEQTYSRGHLPGQVPLGKTDSDEFIPYRVGADGNLLPAFKPIGTVSMAVSSSLTPYVATLASDAAPPGDGETVVIGSVTYTFKAALTNPAVPYEVLIDGSAAAALDNLKLAINGSAGGGSKYGTGTVAHPLVTATTNTDTTQVIAMIAAGELTPPSIAETSSHLSWSSWSGGAGRVALPATGATVVIRNTGSKTVFVKLGGSSVTAATTDFPVYGHGTEVVVRDVATETHLAAVCAALETSNLTITTGAGMPAGSAAVGEVEIKNDEGNPVPVSAAQLPAALTSNGGLKTGLVEALPAGLNSIGAVASNSVVSAATITRPGDINAYIAKDVISNSTSAPAVLEFAGMARANGGTGTIVRARLMTSQKTNTALYRLHLFHTAPTAINDNSPYLLLYANAANRIGSIDFPALGTEDSTNSTAAAGMRPSYDGSYPPPNLWYKCAANDTKLYGILETLSGFSPDNAQTYYIELGADGLS